MDNILKPPPTVRFADRFPPDEALSEADKTARRERTRRAAAEYRELKAAGVERIIHRTPEDIRAAVERRRQRMEALRAECKEEADANLYRPEQNSSQ